MVESKSGWTFNEINARPEKSMESDPRCPNRLGVDSEWISPRTVKPRRSSCFAETLEWNKTSSSELGVQKSGGSHGSDNALPEMRKTNGPGCHPLRTHRTPM